MPGGGAIAKSQEDIEDELHVTVEIDATLSFHEDAAVLPPEGASGLPTGLANGQGGGGGGAGAGFICHIPCCLTPPIPIVCCCIPTGAGA